MPLSFAFCLKKGTWKFLCSVYTLYPKGTWKFPCYFTFYVGKEHGNFYALFANCNCIWKGHKNFEVPSYSAFEYAPRHTRCFQVGSTTLRSHLVRPKDVVEPTKQDGVAYRIPCECGKVYIGETGRPMKDRIKEHERDIRLVRTQTSAVSEHANNTGHNPLSNEVKFIDRDPHWCARRVKEVIHIRLHPNNINRDNGIEIPEAWMPTIKKHNNRRTVR